MSVFLDHDLLQFQDLYVDVIHKAYHRYSNKEWVDIFTDTDVRVEFRPWVSNMNDPLRKHFRFNNYSIILRKRRLSLSMTRITCNHCDDVFFDIRLKKNLKEIHDIISILHEHNQRKLSYWKSFKAWLRRKHHSLVMYQERRRLQKRYDAILPQKSSMLSRLKRIFRYNKTVALSA